MAYNILNNDGSTLLFLPDNTIDQVSTSLTLIGKNYNGYGEHYNNNLIKLMTNFANNASAAPRNPLKGQLWYDTTSKKLKIYDTTFKSVNGAIISGTQPGDMSTGDLWFDTVNNQLKIFDGNTTFVIGPQFSKLIGDNGWVIPQTPIKDVFGDAQSVVLMKSYGEVVGTISRVAFDVDPTDAVNYFSTTSYRVSYGVGVIGDLNCTGQLTSKYLSVSIDIDKLTPATPNVTDYLGDFIAQNTAILSLLAKMFPPILNREEDNVGVPLNSEARVLCTYTNPTAGYEVRRFRFVDQIGLGQSWQPYNIYSNGRNVVP